MDSTCLLIVAVLTSLPSITCRGFSCYVCMWANNNDTCGDAGFALTPEQDDHYAINCSVCYKMVQYNAKGAKSKILRGCGKSEWAYEPICQSLKYLKGLSTQVCACTSDYCNNSWRQYLSFVTVLFTTVFLHVFH